VTLPASEHRGPLEALGLGGSALSRLASYLDTLAAWSPRVNLTAARTPTERVRVLVADVVAAARLPRPGRLIDVGSGNGSPGLVLALLRDDLEVTLLEPRARRWAFLREAARAAGRAGVRVERRRHDGYAGPPADTVTVRGLALPLVELGPLLLPHGRLIVFGGRPEPGPGLRLTGEGEGLPGGVSVFRRG
jgi:16S rRNA (guanine527-N7)-methyltransferase